MRKIIKSSLGLMLFIVLFGSNIYAKEEVKFTYDEFATNYAEVSKEHQVVTSYMSDGGELSYNEEYVPLKPNAITIGGMFNTPKYGYIYHHAEIEFKSSEIEIADNREKFVLSDYVKEESLDNVKSIRFYYSASGIVNAKYKINGTDIEISDSQSMNGRYQSNFESNEGLKYSYDADNFSILKKEIPGYKFYAIEGSEDELFINGEKNVTYVYILDVKEPIEPGGKPVTPTKPEDKDKEIDKGKKSISKNKKIKKDRQSDNKSNKSIATTGSETYMLVVTLLTFTTLVGVRRFIVNKK